MKEKEKNILADADGFTILFRASILSGLQDSVVIHDDLCKIFNRPGVPGCVFSFIRKNARNKITEIPKRESKLKCKELDLTFRQVDPSKRWEISKGISSI